MTRTTTTILTLALLCLAPAAQAGFLWKTDIEIPFLRVGDHFSFDVEQPAVEIEGDEIRRYQATRTSVVLVEGPSRATDAYGIERDTFAVRTDVLEAGELVAAERCHQLAGGVEAVRTDVLAGDGGGTFSWSVGLSAGPVDLGQSASGSSRIIATFGDQSCVGPAPFQGRSLREGDRATMLELGIEDADDVADLRSMPAEPAKFAGRDALVFRFDGKDVLRSASSGRATDEDLASVVGGVDIVLADGIPVVAALDVDIRMDSEDEDNSLIVHIALTGIDAGTGERVDIGDAALPDQHPSATFVRPEALRFDDTSLGLALPFDDAYAALFRDPRPDFAGWLADHPDARLVMALFYIGAGPAPLGAAPTEDGGWILQYADDVDSFSAVVIAPSTVRTPIASVPSPARVPMVMNWHEGDADLVAELPSTIIASESLAQMSASAGVTPGTIRGFVYLLQEIGGEPKAFAVVSQVNAFSGDAEGYGLLVDLGAGATRAVTAEAVETESTLDALEPASGSIGPTDLGVATLGSPTPLLAGATLAAGVGLLALAVKLLLPLYTRLRRDRLLDNPIRARLFDRIRAEPGIHLAELEEFIGIGKGATKHHVDQLAAHQLVFVLDADGYSRCYASGHVPIDVARRLATLRAGSNARVYELYAMRPNLSLREAARELGMSAPSVHRAKKRLLREGILPAAPTTPAISR